MNGSAKAFSLRLFVPLAEANGNSKGFNEFKWVLPLSLIDINALMTPSTRGCECYSNEISTRQMSVEGGVLGFALKRKFLIRNF